MQSTIFININLDIYKNDYMFLLYVFLLYLKTYNYIGIPYSVGCFTKYAGDVRYSSVPAPLVICDGAVVAVHMHIGGVFNKNPLSCICHTCPKQ